MLQKVYNLFKILLGRIVTGDIIKHHLFLIKTIEFCFAFAKAHRLIVLPLRLTHHEHEECGNQKHWNNDNCKVP
ncbi:hypothetical protein D9M68_952330 [compost metagenome]